MSPLIKSEQESRDGSGSRSGGQTLNELGLFLYQYHPVPETRAEWATLVEQARQRGLFEGREGDY